MFVKFIHDKTTYDIIEVDGIEKCTIGQITSIRLFKNGNDIGTRIVDSEAYLMNENGKTIDAYHGENFIIKG